MHQSYPPVQTPPLTWSSITTSTSYSTVKQEAQKELTEAKAMLVLLENNDLAAEIHISGMTLGVCDNRTLRKAVKNQIRELEKAIKGEANSWQ